MTSSSSHLPDAEALYTELARGVKQLLAAAPHLRAFPSRPAGARPADAFSSRPRGQLVRVVDSDLMRGSLGLTRMRERYVTDT